MITWKQDLRNVPHSNGWNGRRYFKNQWRCYRTPRDYTRPLPYETMSNIMTWYRSEAGLQPWISDVGNTHGFYQVGSKPGYNYLAWKTYPKLRDKVYTSGQAEIGTAIAEGRKTLDSMTRKMHNLYRALQVLRTGRVNGRAVKRPVARALGYLDQSVRPKPRKGSTRWKRPKDVAALWLEYWFVVAPTMQDLYTLAEVLIAPYPPARPVRAAAGMAPFQDSQTVSTAFYEAWYWYKIQPVMVQGATPHVINPDQYLLGAVGLTNPASVLFDVTRLSFVTNWFGSLGVFIESLGDFAGLDLRDAFTTYYARTLDANSWETYGVGKSSIRASGQFTERLLGITAPVPEFWFPRKYGMSKTRGATAAALLVSLFTTG